jgi:hypothetical protein
VVTAGVVFDRRDELLDRLRQGPGEEARQEAMPTETGPLPSRWTLRTIRVSFDWLADYSLSGVSRVLERHGLALRSGRVQLFSPDPAYADKEAHLLACLTEAAQYPGEVVLLFMDEMGYYRWPVAALDWMAVTPEPVRVATCADNNKQWRIIGVLNALTGQVNYLDNYIVGRKVVGDMYQAIDQIYPAARHIYVVQDNWSIHSHADVLAVLDILPHIEPIWLPTYAPWLNPIEKLWRWLRQDVLKMHRLADDWPELQRRANAFLDQFATGSHDLLRYVGLLGDGRLAQALRVP